MFCIMHVFQKPFTTFSPDSFRNQNRASDHLELQLQMAISHTAGTEYRNWVQKQQMPSLQSPRRYYAMIVFPKQFIQAFYFLKLL